MSNGNNASATATQPAQQQQEQYVIHVGSQNIYKIRATTATLVYLLRAFLFAGTGYQKGDNFEVRVGAESLIENYRIMTDAEVASIEVIEEPSNNVIYKPTERDDFKNLILEPEVTESIEVGIKKIEMRDILDKEWGLSEIRPQGGKLCLNFYGKPGTGKTASARAVARRLSKNLLQVDYASMISKYYGDTAKNIRAAFEEAKERGAILFFDEADSMLSKRASIGDDGGASSSLNQNRNVLMQELDRFGDVVIFATNFFGNYDEALLRRIAAHVEFRLPNEQMRLAIFQKKIPKKAVENKRIDISVDLKDLASQSEGFSGSDIENTVANAIETVAVKGGKAVDHDSLTKELLKIKRAKDTHSNAGAAKTGSVAATIKSMLPSSGPFDEIITGAAGGKKTGGNKGNA